MASRRDEFRARRRQRHESVGSQGQGGAIGRFSKRSLPASSLAEKFEDGSFTQVQMEGLRSKMLGKLPSEQLFFLRDLVERHGKVETACNDPTNLGLKLLLQSGLQVHLKTAELVNFYQNHPQITDRIFDAYYAHVLNNPSFELDLGARTAYLNALGVICHDHPSFSSWKTEHLSALQ